MEVESFSATELRRSKTHNFALWIASEEKQGNEEGREQISIIVYTREGKNQPGGAMLALQSGDGGKLKSSHRVYLLFQRGSIFGGKV